MHVNTVHVYHNDSVITFNAMYVDAVDTNRFAMWILIQSIQMTRNFD